MARPPRRANVRVAEISNVEEDLYGPNHLPYAEALAAEWAKQPPLPSELLGGGEDNNLVTGRNSSSKTSRRVSRKRVGRYDGALPAQQRGPTPKSNPRREVMPRGRAAAPAPEPEEEETSGPIDPAAYMDKDVSVVSEAHANWLADQTGYEDVDPKTVHLVFALRRRWQKHPDREKYIEAVRKERGLDKPKTKAADEEPEPEETPKATRSRSRSTATKTTSSSSTSKAATATATKAPARSRTAAASGTAPRRGRTASKAAKPASTEEAF